MGHSDDVTIRSVEFTTADGIGLTGELAVPGRCRAGAIVCHPHPQFGGNRFNHVVGALFEALPAAGIAALRFDFRRDFGDGIGEVNDARAAVDALAAETPGVPLFAAGYSFGAVVVLALGHERIAGKVLVAPPLRGALRAPTVPALVLAPADDQFCPPDVSRPVVETWPDAQFEVIDDADHFLNGRTGAVTVQALIWIDLLTA